MAWWCILGNRQQQCLWAKSKQETAAGCSPLSAGGPLSGTWSVGQSGFNTETDRHITIEGNRRFLIYLFDTFNGLMFQSLTLSSEDSCCMSSLMATVCSGWLWWVVCLFVESIVLPFCNDNSLDRRGTTNSWLMLGTAVLSSRDRTPSRSANSTTA